MSKRKERPCAWEREMEELLREKFSAFMDDQILPFLKQEAARLREKPGLLGIKVPKPDDEKSEQPKQCDLMDHLWDSGFAPLMKTCVKCQLVLFEGEHLDAETGEKKQCPEQSTDE